MVMPGEVPSGLDVEAESLERLAEKIAADPIFREDEPKATRDGEFVPGSSEPEIKLSADNAERFSAEIWDICDAYDTATEPWRKRIQEINKAYNMVPDASRQGRQPGSSRLVSEATRANVNVAASRIIEGVMGVRPFMSVEVAASQGRDAATQSLVKQAKGIENFFDSYGPNEMRATKWTPLAILRLSKIGTSILRAMWKEEDKSYWYKDRNNNAQKAQRSSGRISVELIRCENCVAWPVWKNEVEDLDVFGHRSPMTASQVKAWAMRKGLAPEVREELVAIASGEQPSQDKDENLQEDLKDKDIDISGANPYKGQVWITELWGRTALPGKERQGRISWQGFFCEELGRKKCLLWLGYNSLRSQRKPYAKLTYWEEDGSFWGSGIGHEMLYSQAADTALLNLQIDNLKQIANYLRILKAGRMAEDMSDQIAPGFNLVTENPEEDVRIEQLGGDLSHIYQAMDRNDLRMMKATGITSPIQGFGDPVLKSGASPSSLGMLIENAGKKFGQVDRNIRNGLSDLYFFCLELVQQFAPDGIFYDSLDGESANIIIQGRFVPPDGDLRKVFRVKVRAPSATSAKSVLQQNLMIVYNLWAQHVQALLMLASDAFGMENAARLAAMKKESLRFTSDLFQQIVMEQDVPGLTGKLPRLNIEDEETESEETINALLQQLQMQQEEMEMMMQQMGAADGGAQGGAGMEAAGGQPGLPGAGNMPPAL